MTDSRIEKRNGLQGCATTKTPQVKNNRKLQEMQTSEETKLIT